jgi:hypothetical protein
MKNTTNQTALCGLLLALGGCVGPVEIAPLPYAHPANPQAPAGTLPPLGTGLQPVESPASDTPGMAGHEGHRTDAPEAVGKYQCPMHPEVRSDKPGRCPVCGMKLVEAEKRHERHSEQHTGHHAE